MCVCYFVEVVSAPLPPDTHRWIGGIESVFFNEMKGVYCSNNHGVTVIVPDGAIKSGIKAELKLGATLLAPVKFVENTIPVSPVVWLCMNVTLQKPVQIQIPHCINVKSESQLDNLHFARAVHSSDDNTMMEVMNGGKFCLRASFGSIEVDHFCYFCVVNDCYDGKAPDYHYQAVLFQNRYLHNHIWKLQICVMPALPTCEIVSYLVFK